MQGANQKPVPVRMSAGLRPVRAAASGSGTRASIRRVRPLLLISCLLATILAGCYGSEDAASQAQSLPPAPERIVLVVADTLRRDRLAPYGAALATPAVSRLATRGQVFTNAVSSFHQTTMSMASLFTGRTPSLETGDASQALPWTSHNWCGLARLAESQADTCIPKALGTLAEDLHAAGYETLGAVSNRLMFRPHGYERGFDRWIQLGSEQVPVTRAGRVKEAEERTGQQVNAAVRRLLAERRSDRFFLYVHYIDPHEHGFRPDLPDYDAGVLAMDRALGILLDMLAQQDLLDGALVVFTSDHGEYLGARHALTATAKHFGNPSFDSLLLVPLIIAPPTPEDATRLVRSEDIRGLVRRLVGLEDHHASDLETDELFVTEQFYQTYRRGRWKSMWARGDDRMVLFDLHDDPGETRDVAGGNPAVVARHRTRVEVLTAQLGTQQGIDAQRSRDDEDRLRSLGYIE